MTIIEKVICDWGNEEIKLSKHQYPLTWVDGNMVKHFCSYRCAKLWMEENKKEN